MTAYEPGEVGLVNRLLDIIAHEGLVDRGKLEPDARLDEIGVSADDLILIGHAIEREFDRDLLSDNEIEEVATVRELLSLISRRLAAQTGPEVG